MSKRILLPYHKANHRSKDYVLYTIKEIEDALKENLVDAIDVSRYENKEEIAKILRRITNDSIKIYTNLDYEDYRLMYNTIPVCGSEVADFLGIKDIAEIVNSPTMDPAAFGNSAMLDKLRDIPTENTYHDDDSEHL